MNVGNIGSTQGAEKPDMAAEHKGLVKAHTEKAQDSQAGAIQQMLGELGGGSHESSPGSASNVNMGNKEM